jgi:protein ImuA
MSISRDPAALLAARRSVPSDENRADTQVFATVRNAAAAAPLTEIAPAAPGDGTAASGFALAWAQAASTGGLIVWAAPEASFAEDGVPHAEGLAQFGVTLDRLLLVRTQAQIEALWAAEQTLTLRGACVICTVMPAKKALGLTATRRLLLAAEKHKSRCVLLRLDALGASAAWTRWRIAAAPSPGTDHELGPPAFAATLDRNRLGPTGLSWRLHWNAHEHAFHIADDEADTALDRGVAAAPVDRPAAPQRRRAV